MTARNIVCLMLAGMAGMGYAQRSGEVNYGRSRTDERPYVEADPNDVSVTRGPVQRRPRNYMYYYNTERSPYLFTPYVAPINKQPVILGPVQPYSDAEYARLVLSTLSAGSVKPTTAKISGRSILDESGPGDPSQEPKPAEVEVLDVFDRGTLKLATGEEVKLRGVRMPTERDPDDVTRYYAREAMRKLRELTYKQKVFVKLGYPLRDMDGTLLADVHLADGTHLNRVMLEQGYGALDSGDFPADRNLAELVEVEAMARKGRVGLWSKTQ